MNFGNQNGQNPTQLYFNSNLNCMWIRFVAFNRGQVFLEFQAEILANLDTECGIVTYDRGQNESQVCFENLANLLFFSAL